MRKKYRYRLLRTIRDKVVGIALEKLDGELVIQLGNNVIEFDKNAPRLEELPLYIEKISEKREYKNLELYDCTKIRLLDPSQFISIKHLMETADPIDYY